MVFVIDILNTIMNDQLCKECSHELKFHYNSHDGKIYCSQCNLKGRDCYAFEKSWWFIRHITSKHTCKKYQFWTHSLRFPKNFPVKAYTSNQSETFFFGSCRFSVVL